MPVVARKKGLDGHYEKAEGKVQPKKTPTAVAPVRIVFSLLAVLVVICADFYGYFAGARYIWL